MCRAAAALLCLVSAASAQTGADVRPAGAAETELAQAFQGAQVVDLATSKASSVVTLRETVGIPPPSVPVLVKAFNRQTLPSVLKPVFAKPGIMGVTLCGRYIAIIRTDFPKEDRDILLHELVHAYISLASPKPLPFWFQEGSAVLFSTGKGRKFYGKPSKDQVGVMVGQTVDLAETYKQKLQSFSFLIEQAGRGRFYKWYRRAVLTGDVDARPLLGLKPKSQAKESRFKRPFPIWLGVLIGAVVVVVAVAGLYAARRGTGDYY